MRGNAPHTEQAESGRDKILLTALAILGHGAKLKFFVARVFLAERAIPLFGVSAHNKTVERPVSFPRQQSCDDRASWLLSTFRFRESETYGSIVRWEKEKKHGQESLRRESELLGEGLGTL